MAAESLAWFLIVIAVFGLIVGAIGRLLVPGPTPLGVVGTMAAGIVGALIGGFVGRLFLGPSLTQGWIWVLSILGAALVVALVSRRGHASYAPRRRLLSERAYDDRARYDDRVGYRERVVDDDRVGYGDRAGYDDRVVDDADRPYRSRHGRWPRRGLLPGRGREDRTEVDRIGRPYRPVGRRRRRFF